MTARSDARGDDDAYANGAPVRARVPFRVGDRVYAGGQLGVIESIAHSVATEKQLITVAFDRRLRLTFNSDSVAHA